MATGEGNHQMDDAYTVYIYIYLYQEMLKPKMCQQEMEWFTKC